MDTTWSTVGLLSGRLPTIVPALEMTVNVGFAFRRVPRFWLESD
jgi:hypothetical protein